MADSALGNPPCGEGFWEGDGDVSMGIACSLWQAGSLYQKTSGRPVLEREA